MNKPLLLLIIFCTTLFTSCSSKKGISKHKNVSNSELSEKLGFPVSKKDDLKLYSEAAKWLGVPYRYGGNTPAGVDCSGLVCNIYKDVYRIQLERTVAGMYKKNCRKISGSDLKPGDLVFFNTTKKANSTSHVGIFLKNGIFIHSTTSNGVRLSNLKEKYYKNRWINGGKVKR